MEDEGEQFGLAEALGDARSLKLDFREARKIEKCRRAYGWSSATT